MRQRPAWAVMLVRAMLVGAVAILFAATGSRVSAQTSAAKAPAPSTARASDAPPAGRATSLGEAFFIQKNARTGGVEWFGSLIIWFLLLLSVASMALIGALAWATRRVAILPTPLVAELRRALRAEDLRAAGARVLDDASYFAEVMAAVLPEARFGRDAMLRALERGSDERATERLRRIELLSVIGAVSPMIGLFGTVYGIILAFREIVAAGGAPDPVGLAAGIGTALVTTFWGLITAIPALSAYALLRNTLDARTAEATIAAEDMVNLIAPPAPEPDSARGGPGAPGASRPAHHAAT